MCQSGSQTPLSQLAGLLPWSVRNAPFLSNKDSYVATSSYGKLSNQKKKKKIIQKPGVKVHYSCGSLTFMGEIWKCFYWNLKYVELNANHCKLWRFKQASLYLCEAWLFLPLAPYYLLYKSISIAFSCCIQDTAVYHLSYSHYISPFFGRQSCLQSKTSWQKEIGTRTWDGIMQQSAFHTPA